MAGRQGFITNHLTYVYQNAPDNASAAFGVDTSDSDKWKICVKLDDSAYLFPVSQFIIDPAANGNITLAPNGSGKVITSYTGVGTIISDASGVLTSVTPGVAGTVLTSNGVAVAPTWAAPASAIVSSVSGTVNQITVSPITGATVVGLVASPTVTGNWTTTAGNLALPTSTSTAGQVTINAVRYLHNGGIATSVFAGPSAGNFTATAANNVGIGYQSISNATSGGSNTCIGSQAGKAITIGTANQLFGYQAGWAINTGTENIGIGSDCLYTATSAADNVAIGGNALFSLQTTLKNTAVGFGALYDLTLGSRNLALGESSGNSYTSNESNNICICNLGVIGESNKIHIGTQGSGAGQQNACYIAGIHGVTPGGASIQTVTIDANGQLGSTTSSGMTWSRPTTTPIALVANNGYVQANAGAGLTTFTLPATAALGTEIEIIGESSGGWTVTQAAGQSIQYGNVATTIGVGGSLSSTNRYDTVTLKCRVADLAWSVVGSVGILSVV